MSQNPRIAGITSCLRRVYAEQKRVSLARFKKATEKVLTGKEATEVFEYITSIKVALIPSTQRMYIWKCSQDFFNNQFVEELCKEINLREKKDVRHKKEIVIPEKVDNKLDLTKVSLEELITAIEDRGWEVTIKHIYNII